MNMKMMKKKKTKRKKSNQEIVEKLDEVIRLLKKIKDNTESTSGWV